MALAPICYVVFLMLCPRDLAAQDYKTLNTRILIYQDLKIKVHFQIKVNLEK